MIELLIEAERAMSFGLHDRAEQVYRQVVAADPRNAIAVVGLARVALERGDEMGALTLARQALAIDPEDDKAGRLVERLEEILRTRGVEVQPAAAAVAATADAEPAAAADTPAAVDAPAPAVDAPAVPPRSWLDRLRRRRS